MSTRKEVETYPAEELVKTPSESTVCHGYVFLHNISESVLTITNHHHEAWHYHGSGRTRRSPVNTGAGGGTYCDNCSLAISLASGKAAQDLTLVDLVSYLISLTSGRQFYLVYDDVMPGVEGVVRTFQEMLGDTMLLPYDPSILLLRVALTSNYHVQAMRNVFILCSVIHIVRMFEEVRKKVLESSTVQWFVIVDEDLTEELPVLLREGTQVALVQRVTPQKAQLFSSMVDPDGHIRFHRVGSWSVIRRTNDHEVKSKLIPDLQQLYSDFQGRQLVLSVNDNWPFFKIQAMENGTVIPIAGVDFNVINSLGEKLNFTDLPLAGSRETVVDFTMPYYFESTTLVSRAPKQKNRSFAVFSPFTVEVWLCICLVTLLVGPILYLVTRLLVAYTEEEDRAQYSLQNFSFNMYRNLMVQSNLIISHRWSLRFLFFCWYLFSFYIYALYSGTLTAVLAIPAFEKPIDSLHDLAQARQDGYTIGTVRDTSFVVALKVISDGVSQP
ncbi:uncharacterized protein [Panulirus ornatus]|uniref:uncharacterized protein n=1 Tax=Panulirus ornatus TaxID=150431 RepID=UPI003A8A5E00